MSRTRIAILGCALSAMAGAANAAPRPNVLLLLSDDQRADTIAALGNPIIRTPNLDRLVRAGTVFDRAFSPNPLCVPARAEIMTGTCGLRGGKLDMRLEGKPLLAEALRAAGYRTCYVGKWHNQGLPDTRGYEQNQGVYYGGGGKKLTFPVDHDGRPVTGYVGWVFHDAQGRTQPEMGVGLTPDINARMADAAIALIGREAGRPFFLHVNFTAPHDPLLLPPGWEKTYDPAKIPLPANFRPEHPFDHGNLLGRDENLMARPRTAAEVRRETAAYYAVVSHMDAEIGRILAALKESGQAEKTVVIFASDQGLGLGSHGLRGKQNMYEHTVRAPLVIAGPGLPRGRRLPALCYLRDLFPTVCELAGVPVPAGVEARSLLPLLRGERESVYSCVYGYFGGLQRMIRTDRWKLVYYPQIDRYQLFDLGQDPDELQDLAGRPEHAGTMKPLRAQLEAWLRERDAL